MAHTVTVVAAWEFANAAAPMAETAAAIIAATHVFPLFIFFLLTFGRYAVNLCMFARSMPVAAALDFRRN